MIGGEVEAVGVMLQGLEKGKAATETLRAAAPPKPERAMVPPPDPVRVASDGSVVLLKVGAVGGSVTLVGRLAVTDECKFARITVDQSEDLLDEADGKAPGPPALTSPEWVGSWEEGLQLMDRYPWARLHPVAVHPEFVERVRVAVEERLAGEPQHRSVERERGNWERLLGRSGMKGGEGDL